LFCDSRLGRWNTVDGLVIMVDELTQGFAKLEQNVIVISPNYDKNKYGDQEYLSKNLIGIHK